MPHQHESNITNCSECHSCDCCDWLPHADGGGRWVCDTCKTELYAHICAYCEREAAIDQCESEEQMMPICYECAEKTHESEE
ncbi:hypothetical protein BOO30_00180 [Vibrio navarrensis]|uniref:hypothetical protein n=1 Tax=Vibrio navarrensis TaxID=29495 RepID=UPI0018699C3F|nr:hypothetical protein [Vibrio navarrensis]MBE4578321.1 hypothetical protein [Vibrio navarrensis]MBE4594872.1 hypothetical protein [Vibrio navarrensis]